MNTARILLCLPCLLFSLSAWPEAPANNPSQSGAKVESSRLAAPGTLTGYRNDKANEDSVAMPQPQQVAPPPVLRYHKDRHPRPESRFPQFGHTPGQGNPWEYGAKASVPRSRTLPPSATTPTPGNPWRLDQRLLSAPGMPGLDPALPLAPADPLLSPMPYRPYGATPYGMYPPAAGTNLMPFGQGFPPVYRDGRDSFPFSMPMDWF